MQVAGLRFAGGNELFAVQEVEVLVVVDDETVERMIDQRFAWPAKNGGRSEVGLLDQAGLVEREITHRRQIVEVSIARAGRVQCQLRAVDRLLHTTPDATAQLDDGEQVAEHAPDGLDGEQASRSYQRYLKSFETTIPEHYESGLNLKKQ